MKVIQLVTLALACLHPLRAAKQSSGQGGFLALFRHLWDWLAGSGDPARPKTALRRPPIRKRPAHKRARDAPTYAISATFSDDPLPPIQPIHRGVPRRPIDTPQALREHADSIQAFRTYLEANGRLQELRDFDRRRVEADEEAREDVARAERYMDSAERGLEPYEDPRLINHNWSDQELEKTEDAYHDPSSVSNDVHK